MTKTEDFIELIRNNPELPIIPVVNYEICCGDCPNWWMGSFGSARIDYYLIGDEKFYFKDDDMEDILSSVYGDEYEKMSDEECEKACAELGWIKAIIVYIDLPE